MRDNKKQKRKSIVNFSFILTLALILYVIVELDNIQDKQEYNIRCEMLGYNRLTDYNRDFFTFSDDCPIQLECDYKIIQERYSGKLECDSFNKWGECKHKKYKIEVCK